MAATDDVLLYKFLKQVWDHLVFSIWVLIQLLTQISQNVNPVFVFDGSYKFKHVPVKHEVTCLLLRDEGAHRWNWDFTHLHVFYFYNLSFFWLLSCLVIGQLLVDNSV